MTHYVEYAGIRMEFALDGKNYKFTDKSGKQLTYRAIDFDTLCELCERYSHYAECAKCHL